MRPLAKGAPPAILVKDGPDWTAKYQIEILAGNTTYRPWRSRPVVAALVRETCGKCAYCEAVIADVAAPHVEHIKPKSIFPELVVDWDNLTVACPACNTRKGFYYSAAAPLLNPYMENPSDHLDFVGPAVMGKVGDDLGQITVAKLDLMRDALLIERMKRIQAVWAHIDRWAREGDSDKKEIYADVVRREIDETKEFTATLRAYVEQRGFPLCP
jgi:uncharacterized protein (TIGR02646 family)